MRPVRKSGPPSRCSRRSWAGTGRRPSPSADWGKSHRFAGSGDRAAIGNLVYDALRRRRSLAAQMQRHRPALRWPPRPARSASRPPPVIAGADGSAHALEPLSEAEQAGLARELPRRSPAGVRGDIPDWLRGLVERAFGAAAGEEGRPWRGARRSTCAATCSRPTGTKC